MGFSEVSTAGSSHARSLRWPVSPSQALGLLVFSTFIVVLTETIMSVALVSLTRDLGISVPTAQWLTTGYLLTMAIVIPTSGYLLQRFTTRQAFITAMSLFCIGTLIAALSISFPPLLIGRLVQAAGAAVMMPLLMTAVLNTVAAQRRGTVMGTVSIVIAVAPALGPALSGALLQTLDWHFLFWAVLPITVAALAFGIVTLPNLTATSAPSLDITSVVLSAMAFGSLVYGLSAIGEAANHTAAVPPAFPIGVGVITVCVFAARQHRLAPSGRALLNLNTLRSPQFVFAVAGTACVSMTLLGTLTVLPLYLQQVRGAGTLTTGLLMLPGGLLMAALSPVSGRLYDRVGAGPLVIPGAVVLVVAQVWFALSLTEHSPTWIAAGAFTVMHIGLAFLFTPLMTAALSPLTDNLYSHGSATLSTLQQLAGAAGAATFVAFVALGTQARKAEGAQTASAAAGGVRDAFMFGAALSALTVIAAIALAIMSRRRRESPSRTTEVDTSARPSDAMA